MNILAIDSSTDVCSVALGCGAEVHEEESRSRSGHSQVILELVERVLDNAQTALADLDLVAVDVGPGSFTGLRIGLGVAKGIAYANRLPVVGFFSLEILSYQTPAGIVIPALDARMGEVYAAIYKTHLTSRPIPIGTMHISKPEDVDVPRDDQVIGLGSGWDNYGQALGGDDRGNVHVLGNRMPRANDLARLAALTTCEDWVSSLDLEAAYVRDRVVQLPAGRT